MDLRSYLKAHGISSSAFAADIGVSAMAVSRYLNHGRMPKRDILEKIASRTDGAVLPNDFFGASNGASDADEAA